LKSSLGLASYHGAINAAKEENLAGFRVLPINSELVEQVRSTLKSSQYGHPAHVELAKGSPEKGL
jgi:hypothetical protein